MHNIDYYNCSPCDFYDQDPEDFGYRYDAKNMEYVEIDEDDQDDFDSLDLEEQFEKLLQE